MSAAVAAALALGIALGIFTWALVTFAYATTDAARIIRRWQRARRRRTGRA